MDTYGDMVTLLLCFFVLLYSMSTISEENWKAIVQSFNPSAIDAMKITSGDSGPVADETDGLGLDEGIGPEPAEQITQEDVINALQQLYESLKEYSESSEQGQNIEIVKGDGYVFVSFNDAVFFDGDSYVLRRDGEEILDVVSEALNAAAPYIDELRVMGHTAQAVANRRNNPRTDRFLASNRATIVTVYIQTRCDLDPARIISMGYGQHRPVASNDTPETRRRNRRVELLITGQDLLSKIGDSLQQYSSIRAGEAMLITGDGAQSSALVDAEP